ncbi:helix-turn-helix domain-containing protein [Priestia aryabhattai]|uniref:helix-turn-helix domain-containing protein n=1 Tax=Priestia aryabhattai TaxID=412384 RepID=UPI002E1E9216|nr:helix-turn-helix domain-containing protein [Priestia aryabhattai]
MKEFEYIKPELKRKFIRECVLTSAETLELLEISRPRLSKMIKDGKIEPAKKSGATSLFLKDDLLKKKEELIKLRKKYGPWETSSGDKNDQ